MVLGRLAVAAAAVAGVASGGGGDSESCPAQESGALSGASMREYCIIGAGPGGLQMAAQLQIIFTYVTANVFFHDPRLARPLEEDADVKGTADVILVAANSVCFVLLALIICRGVHRSVTSDQLRDADGHDVLAPILPGGVEFHLFLSHTWSFGQDQMRIIKEKVARRVPGLRIFLDVDDLEDIGALESEIGQSAL